VLFENHLCVLFLITTITMTAQFLHAHSSQNQPQRYTLVFRDGQLLRHQDALTLMQYRSDARLAEVRPEVPVAAGHGYNLQTDRANSY
jgi:hypothetical protein